jgi:hypothetical protein
MSQVLVRVTDTGTGSKRITIPKSLLESKLGNTEYALISEDKDGLLIRPAEVRAKKP